MTLPGVSDLIPPRFTPPLDEDFRPAALFNQAFRRATVQDGVRLVIALERAPAEISTFETRVFPNGHPRATDNLAYVERLVKFLLWQRGSYRVYVGGPETVGKHIEQAYAAGGERAFDHRFMGEQVYQKPFEVVTCEA